MNDTYPTSSPSGASFNYYKILFIIMAVVAIILWYKSCHPKALPVATTVTSIAEQKTVIRVDSIASQKYQDSVNTLVDSYEGELKRVKAELEHTQDVVLGVQQDMNDLLVNTLVPDTCLEFQKKAAAMNKKLAASTAAAQALCNKAVAAQRAVINQKDVLIANGKKDAAKLRVNLDSCFAQQKKLQKSIKDFKPKPYLSAGLMAQSFWVQPYKIEAGVFLQYTNKRKSSFSIGVTTEQRAFFSLSKKLF